MLNYSFDIFDTLLTRVIAKPQDVFWLVQRRIGFDILVSDQVRRVFPYARIWAEFRARHGSGREDITLKHIYNCLDNELSLGHAVQDTLMNLELSVERESSVPIAANIRKVRELQAKGIKVIFISDMYLPSEFLYELLDAHGICKELSSLYVSGEVGLTKGSGSLFAHVLKHEGLEPGQLVHCGDHFYSDVIVPARLGIRTDPYVTGTASLISGRLRKKFLIGGYLLRVMTARILMYSTSCR